MPDKTVAATLSRRGFLKNSGALLIGFHLPLRGLPAAAKLPNQDTPLLANAFIRIAPDNQITILVNHAEMGNGPYTSLPMMIAEELDLDWQSISVEPAPTRPEYFHADWGVYLTGGSSSTPSSWTPLRTAGAKTRAMLIEAASRYWQVAADALTTENGFVLHSGNGQRLAYGELIGIIREQNIQPPEQVALKNPSDFKILGTDVKRLEGPEKVDGTAQFGIDVRLPNLHFASVARAPVYGGTVKAFNASAAKKIKGVVAVKQTSNGIAVIAKHYWAARKGRDALNVEWDLGSNTELSSERFYQEYRALSKQPGLVAEDIGDIDKAFTQASQVLDAVYEVPYLAHAPMEPINCTALVSSDKCEIWVGTQFQSNDRKMAAELLGLPEESVTINRTLMGGGFGRRASTTADFVVDAVEVARGEAFPVMVIWSREEDMHCGFYRPLFVHRLKGGIDSKGNPMAWRQRAVGQSIMQNTLQEKVYMANGIDVYSLDGCVDQPYKIPNHRIESHNPPKIGVLPLWWRSVGQTHTGFAYECFLDELAHLGERDPLQLRLDLCQESPRMKKVLDVIKQKADWHKPLGKNRGRGVSARQAFGSALAQVAEVTLLENGNFHVDRVVCVIDCGFAVNPWGVESQIQGGIVYGLTATAFGDIELEQGAIQQTNFHDYPMMRISHMPHVEVHIIDSDGPPTGVGEPGTAPIAAAVCNALFDASGKRVRKLPLDKQGFSLI